MPDNLFVYVCFVFINVAFQAPSQIIVMNHQIEKMNRPQGVTSEVLFVQKYYVRWPLNFLLNGWLNHIAGRTRTYSSHHLLLP